MIEVKQTCPLGHTCETARDNVIHRCAWYVQIAGQNPNTGEIENKFRCAIAWFPILQLEVARTNRGQTAAIESFRNEMVEGNNAFLSLASQAAGSKRLVQIG